MTIYYSVRSWLGFWTIGKWAIFWTEKSVKRNFFLPWFIFVWNYIPLIMSSNESWNKSKNFINVNLVFFLSFKICYFLLNCFLFNLGFEININNFGKFSVNIDIIFLYNHIYNNRFHISVPVLFIKNVKNSYN